MQGQYATNEWEQGQCTMPYILFRGKLFDDKITGGFLELLCLENICVRKMNECVVSVTHAQ